MRLVAPLRLLLAVVVFQERVCFVVRSLLKKSDTASHTASLFLCFILDTMTSLQLARKAHQANVMHRPSILYKRVMKELPRILMIYDIDMPYPDAKAAVRKHFYNQKDIKDRRVTEMLVEQGYMSLETTMLQHKQKTHLLQLLEGYTIPMEAERKRLHPDSSIDDQFMRA